MDNIIVYSKLPNSILIINKKNADLMGTDRSLEILAIKVDLLNFEIFEPELLQRYFKFSPWEISTDTDDGNFKNLLKKNLSNQEIEERIIKPLIANTLN